MPHILAIANQKGGVGKTTTAVNLAASLAVAEQRTLLIDGDPQGNATSGIGLLRESLTATVYDLLIGGARAAEVRLRGVQFKHLDVLPATADLAGAEVELISRPRRDQIMRDALRPIAEEYDYILIDCPPSLGLITVNMLAAADALLIPVQCEYYALEGLSQLLNTVHLVQQSVNERLSIDGVLLTMYDSRLNLSRQVAADAREYFGPKVYDSVIPRNVRLAEAPSFGKPIILYDVTSVGAQAYMAAAKEMLRRHWSAAHAGTPAGTHAGTHASSARRRDHAAAAAAAAADIAAPAPLGDAALASTADPGGAAPHAGEHPEGNPGGEIGADDARGAGAREEARGDGRASGIVPERTPLNAG